MDWVELVRSKETEIFGEIVDSLKCATGCVSDGVEDVLYLTTDGEMFWTRDSRGSLSSRVYSGEAIVLFSHPIDALGCYGCTDECYEFDMNPEYSDEEINEQIKKDEILGEVWMNVDKVTKRY